VTAAVEAAAGGRSVTVMPRPPPPRFSGPRLEGLRSAVAAAAATAKAAGPDSSAGSDARVETLPLDYTEQGGSELAARCRELSLDAVFAYNDEYAMLVLRSLHDAGLDAPEELAVIGADDLMLGRLLRPRLTTVHMSLPEGEDLADLVHRLVSDPGAAPISDNLLTIRLVARDSG